MSSEALGMASGLIEAHTSAPMRFAVRLEAGETTIALFHFRHLGAEY